MIGLVAIVICGILNLYRSRGKYFNSCLEDISYIRAEINDVEGNPEDLSLTNQIWPAFSQLYDHFVLWWNPSCASNESSAYAYGLRDMRHAEIC